ncbi:DUF2087 domain-containing protein [Paenibacillus shunpengii]|uniref:DUF2087 domain-containing protein n=1 Tax=Paenibacillus shunpengii TaxID=2054424 RepID=A0ABW5SNQ6_9BACL|nr:hypothetical protein BK126_18325 [Paenibacillus sp. FSL H7-0326]
MPWEQVYVSVRRKMIEHGFMDRTDDCSLYWITG